MPCPPYLHTASETMAHRQLVLRHTSDDDSPHLQPQKLVPNLHRALHRKNESVWAHFPSRRNGGLWAHFPNGKNGSLGTLSQWEEWGSLGTLSQWEEWGSLGILFQWEECAKDQGRGTQVPFLEPPKEHLAFWREADWLYVVHRAWDPGGQWGRHGQPSCPIMGIAPKEPC